MIKKHCLSNFQKKKNLESYINTHIQSSNKQKRFEIICIGDTIYIVISHKLTYTHVNYIYLQIPWFLFFFFSNTKINHFTVQCARGSGLLELQSSYSCILCYTQSSSHINEKTAKYNFFFSTWKTHFICVLYIYICITIYTHILQTSWHFSLFLYRLPNYAHVTCTSQEEKLKIFLEINSYVTLT